jgi:hypothetical protein
MISGIYLFMLKAIIVYFFIKMLIEILVIGLELLLFIFKLLTLNKKE